MVMGKPAPFVRAFVDAVDAAIRTHQPQHALSGTQRTWLAFYIDVHKKIREPEG
jgi:hypothetical protein